MDYRNKILTHYAHELFQESWKYTYNWDDWSWRKKINIFYTANSHHAKESMPWRISSGGGGQIQDFENGEARSFELYPKNVC